MKILSLQSIKLPKNCNKFRSHFIPITWTNIPH